jgi:hypothetical protein
MILFCDIHTSSQCAYYWKWDDDDDDDDDDGSDKYITT